ncbi:MAG: ATPase, partial [bacterium]
EIKYTAAPQISKSLQIAIQDLDTEKNFIIVPQTEPYPASKNITVCGLAVFLSRHLFAEICR